MTLNTSSANSSNPNKSSIVTDPSSLDFYSFNYPVLSEDYMDAHYLPYVNLATPSTEGNMIQTSAPQPGRNAQTPGPNPRLNANIRREPINNQIYYMDSKGDWTSDSMISEAVSKRRQQNRNSQRTFRERSRLRTEELQKTNKFLQQYTCTLLEENDRLKRELAQFSAVQNQLTVDSAACSSVSPTSSPVEYCLSTKTTKQKDKEFSDTKEDWDLIQDYCL